MQGSGRSWWAPVERSGGAELVIDDMQIPLAAAPFDLLPSNINTGMFRAPFAASGHVIPRDCNYPAVFGSTVTVDLVTLWCQTCRTTPPRAAQSRCLQA